MTKKIYYVILFLIFISFSYAQDPLEPDYSLEKVSPAVQQALQKHILFNPDAENRIGYLYIGDHEESISQATWLYIKQGLEYYKQTKPIFIILEIDTPGGEVFVAQKISDALKEMDLQYQIPVVAFINNWAISAGAMIAYACRFITTVKDGSMGAAEPVLSGESGKMEAASEKINSALRADFASRAGYYDRNPLIAEAMVDKDIILVLREGKIIKLDHEDQIRYNPPHADQVITPKGKLLTLDAVKMLEYGVADLLLPPQKIHQITREEKASGYWTGNQMLLFHAPFFSSIPHPIIQAYKMDWKTRFFVFLANPVVASLLFMGLLIGAYLEFQNPGLSLPGLISATCLFFIILSNFSLELGSWLELILLLTGLALIIVDLFIFPTFGILIFLGSLLFLGGLLSLFLPGLSSVDFDYDTQTLNAAGQFVTARLAWFCGALILSVLIIVLMSRYFFPHFKGLNRLVLKGHEQDASKGYMAPDNPDTLPQPGAEGVVLATLRPAGKIIIHDKIYDAMSYGGFIEANEHIIVLRLEGSVIVVARKQGNLSL